ncbi:flavin-dependent oxidoreductase, methylene-tetrahydromethanopterin reductase [Frankia torreyi]|uniref:Flavin-dependent oxidoreductase, methylene-tetrahydromethanopterin reductase n=1 Tax=Frankia torreyi TaxID=1856 RepID=A0A0D8BGM1_9ACTN|nr:MULTISPECIES: LLM class flavin-dependent oxidoreductase [Frankia]KJE23418.1 flavin-dependent oxidoreductase, methylene-tetrahydromethanopterin reductase [Frankia torreyi]KQM05580.1 flavin-dependent oxidoreductase/methylene-tetrahydromethanopterin reductase [Frankia sp. CpI1-P]
MSVHAHWFLPTSGDSRNLDAAAVSAKETPHLQPAAQRPPSIGYLAQIAAAAEHLGYEAVLTPTGTWCEDAWLTTAALLRETTRLRFLVAFRPGFLSPTLAAQMAATYQRISGGRLLLNVVTGGDADEQQRFGDWLNHDARYRRTEEFLQVVRGVWTGRPVNYDGEHYAVRGATVRERPDPTPPIFFGGASPAAELVAARQADVYLLWGEPPAAVAERLDRMRALAKDQDRELQFGIRLHVITRDTAGAAWAVADELLAQLDPAAIAAAQRRFARTESVGQQRMAALHRGSLDALEISPNLWAGFGLVRGGAGTALVGSHAEVADRIAEYHDLGIEHVILSGHPHLEEAYWFAEGVLPLLRHRGLLAPSPVSADAIRA